MFGDSSISVAQKFFDLLSIEKFRFEAKKAFYKDWEVRIWTNTRKVWISEIKNSIFDVKKSILK